MYKFLLTGDKFMPEIHLKQPALFNYSTCKPFTKNKEGLEKLKKNRGLEIYLSKQTRYSLLST